MTQCLLSLTDVFRQAELREAVWKQADSSKAISSASILSFRTSLQLFTSSYDKPLETAVAEVWTAAQDCGDPLRAPDSNHQFSELQTWKIPYKGCERMFGSSQKKR